MISSAARRLRRTVLWIGVATLLKGLDFALRRTNYKRVSLWLLRLSPKPSPDHADLAKALSTARLVDRVAAHPAIHATCLRRSLALWWLLRWRRIPSDVQLGINLNGGHAWVKYFDYVINDRADVGSFYVQYGDDLSPEKMSTFS